MAFDVYNLEFRNRCCEMTIGGYHFERADDYKVQLLGLQHKVSIHSEFSIEPCTGAHRATARVGLPDSEPCAALPWSNADATGLDDILLLLSIFTGRQVFVLRDGGETQSPLVLVADPRQAMWGGVIELSIPYEASCPLDEDDPMSVSDVGLQLHLNRVYELIGTGDWREKYREGYYLFLFRSMLQTRTIESAFSQCWTIWEHLFSVLNDGWMAKPRKAASADKIAFLLVAHGVRERLQQNEKGRIADLVEIRNRLLHFGQFPEKGAVHDDALLFIHMTQWVVARTLALWPSEAFDTLDRFERFITRTADADQRRNAGGRALARR